MHRKQTHSEHKHLPSEVPIFEVNHLSFSYDKKPVFTDLSFKIYKDDMVGLIGSNGSGKSTLIKNLLGILKPNSGEILICGTPIKQFNNWKDIGYISQNVTNFNSSFPATVKEIVMSNLTTTIGMGRFPKKIHYDMVDHALEQVDMLKYKNQLIGQLSGGQQQRIFIARSLVHQPKILLLDEPTVGIDTNSEHKIYELLHTLNKQNHMAILIISHDIGAVFKHMNHLLCMGFHKFFSHETCHSASPAFLEEIYGHPVILHTFEDKKNC